MNREQTLRRRIKLLTWLFIFGLVTSGATAIPLRWELDVLANLLSDPAVTESHAISRAYSKMAAEQAALFQDRKFPAEAEQLFQMATELSPAILKSPSDTRSPHRCHCRGRERIQGRVSQRIASRFTGTLEADQFRA